MKAMTTTVLDDIVQQLLQALPGGAPAGRWMRYEREFMEIPKLREEDDPSLPMGEWERPIVKADWRKVANACVELLRDHTKDFQLAGWLCDAWIRTARMDGLCAGLALASGLAERYWADAWPAIEDGDADRRVAPFVWMNTNLPLTLRLNVVLLPAALHRADAVTLLDWERAPTADDAKSGDGQPRSRREIRDSVKLVDGDGLRALSQRASEGLATLHVLSGYLDDKLGQESPSLSKLVATLEAVRMAADSLLQELPAPVAKAPAQEPTVDTNAVGADVEGFVARQDAGSAQGIDGADSGAHAAAAMAARAAQIATQAAMQAPTQSTAPVQGRPAVFSNREQAYEALAEIAAFLKTVEPHSPTPYLVQRAVALGQMGLPQMVKEVSASAGSLDKFFELLGVAPPN